MASCVLAEKPVNKKVGEGAAAAPKMTIKGIWPAGTEFVQSAMLSCQRVSEETMYVSWYDNSEQARSVQDRKTSLQQSVKLLNQVPLGCKLKLIVDASEMSIWFATTNLQEWVEQLCKTRGWKQIDTCLVVVSSGVVRHILEIFPMENRVTFVPSVEEACDMLKVDPDIIM